jgi:nucleotide-binding universal stress UspA family protein
METILMPTDFSPASNNAMEYAMELAKLLDAKLILINAYPVPPANYDGGFSVDILTASQNAAQQRLDEVKAELQLKNEYRIEIETAVEIGPAEDVIHVAANRYGADLIVMGIVKDAGPIKEHLVGSTAVRVARHLDIPTFIVPEDVKFRPIRKISFACDLDKTEETSLIYVAKYFSQLFNAELEIVNVERPAEEVSYEKARTSVFVERKLESLKHKTVYVTDEDAAKGLEDYFLAHPTDLIMVNPKKHNIFHNLFKESITNELAFHVHAPILAIH